MKLKDAFTFCKKSTIKAGEGLPQGKYPFFTSSDTKRLCINTYIYDGESVILGTGGMPSCNYFNGQFATSTDTFVLQAKATVLPKFLYWFLRHDNLSILEKGFHGAGLKHISKDYISEIELPELSLEDQKHIIDVCDLYDEIKQKLYRKNELYDELVKSRFIELFGDTILNPFGWEKDSLGAVCDVRDGTHDSPQYYETGYPLVTSKNVTGGKIDLTDCSLICEADFKKINER